MDLLHEHIPRHFRSIYIDEMVRDEFEEHDAVETDRLSIYH